LIEGRESAARAVIVFVDHKSFILAPRVIMENAPSNYVRMKFETYQAAANLIDQ
jgi:hypothetical protein